MPAEIGYDTIHFESLRNELAALNEGAIADGLVAVRDGVVVVPAKPRRVRRKARADAKAKAEAAPPEAAEPERKTKEKPEKKPRKPSPDRSPAAARRLLAMLQRQDQDESPDVAGTSFTEAGVERLLAHLNTRRKKQGGGAWRRFIQRADRYLKRPVPLGIRTVRGVGFDRLQVLARHLEEIETGGWERFQAARAVRRRKVAPPLPLTRDEASAEPAGLAREGGPR